ncbi:MAG TPA: glycerol-3-phosphate acyltransferase [Spirochaetia bacterium]|nr:glycerol-3-phosphate acyltransferase [Spirochaetia bacterium]
MSVILMILVFIAAYLLGSINFAIIVTHMAKGADIRDYGNKNPGAANVSRSLGFGYGLLVLALDFAKAFLPMLAAKYFVFQDSSAGSYFGILITGLLAVIGHCKPIYYGFHGGRGISSVVALYVFFVPGEFIISALLASLIVWLFIRNVRFRIGRWIPIVFVTLTPFTVLASTLFVTPDSPLSGFIGGHPWYVVVGTFISSLSLLFINFLFTGKALKELASQAFDWQD